MKAILKLEEVAMTLAGLYLLSFYTLGLPAWLWCILFFVPDMSMMGYGINPRYGAFLYNLFHHKGVAITMALLGFVISTDVLLASGVLLFAHASFDRILGYGLKYETGFANTHLGFLQKEEEKVKVI